MCLAKLSLVHRKKRKGCAVSIFSIVVLVLPTLLIAEPAAGDSSPSGDAILDESSASQGSVSSPETDVSGMSLDDISPEWSANATPLNELEWLNGAVHSVPSAAEVGPSVIPWNPVKRNFVENALGYVYETPSGTYTFLKSQPLLFKFLQYPNSTEIARGSLLPTSDYPLVWGPCAVNANESSYVVDCTASFEGTGMGMSIHLNVSFSSNLGPKFSIEVIPDAYTPKDRLWIEWVVLTNLTSTQIGGNSAMAISSGGPTAFAQPSSNYCDIGILLTSGAFEPCARIGWDGERAESIKTGKLVCSNGIQGMGVSVVFPKGQLRIDPSLVLSGNVVNSGPSFKHNVFYCDNRYWCFYLLDGKIQYSTSVDLDAWNGPYSTNIVPRTSQDFDVATLGNHVLMSTITQNTSVPRLMIWHGTAEKGLIRWEGGRIVYNLTAAWLPSLGSCAITGDGAFWSSVAYGIRSTSKTIWEVGVFRTYSIKTSAPFDTVKLNIAENVGASTCILVPKLHSRMTVLATSNSSSTSGIWWAEFTPNPKDNTWTGSWNPSNGNLNRYVTSVNDLLDLSASATSDDAVHVAFRSSAGITYARLANHTFKNIKDFPSSSPDCPSLSSDYADNLHLFFLEGTQTIKYARASCQNIADGSWIFADPITFLTESGSCTRLTSSSSAIEAATAAWTESSSHGTLLVMATVPVQPGIQQVGLQADPWSRAGLSPNQPFAMDLDAAVSVGSGLLTVRQVDITCPGKGGMDLSISRIYRTPAILLSGEPFTNTTSAYSIDQLWSFDLPRIAEPIVYLWGGQEYLITWKNNVFENHIGEHFKLLRPKYGIPSAYILYANDGTKYEFGSDGLLNKITDPSGYNSITCGYSSSSPKKLTTITDSVGRVATFSYDALNGTLSKLSYAGRNITYVVSKEQKRLLAVIDELGRKTNFTYTKDTSKLLSAVTYPTRGMLKVTSMACAVGTDLRVFLVTSLKSYSSSTSRVRASYFEYDVFKGRVLHTDVRYYGSSDSDYKGRVSHDFYPTGMGYLMRIFDSFEEPLRSIRTWYGTSGDIQCQDVYFGNNATPSSSVGMSDDWGNLIYSRDAVDHEQFLTYLASSTQNAYKAPANLKLVASGKIYYDNFDSRETNDWVKLAGGTYEMDSLIAPWQAPSLKISDGSSPANASLTFPRTLSTDNMLVFDAAVSAGSSTPVFVITSSGSGGIQIKLDMDGKIKFTDFTTSQNPVWRVASSFVPGAFSEICIKIFNAPSNTFDFFVDGVRANASSSYAWSGTSGLSKLSVDPPSATISVWIDDIRILGSDHVWVDNLPVGLKAVLETPEGAHINSTRDPYNTLVSISVARGYSLLPTVVLEVKDVSDRVLGEYPRREVWGGDRYAYSAPFELSSFVKTRSGFGNPVLAAQTYIDESWPSGTTQANVFAMYDSRYSWNITSYESYRNSSWGSNFHNSVYWSGTHYHGFDSTTQMPVNKDTYIAQYIWVPYGADPDQILLGFRTKASDSNEYRVYWGSNVMVLNGGVSKGCANKTIDIEPGRWSVLCFKGSDMNITSTTNVNMKGVRFALHGGMARWDAMIRGDSSLASISIDGLTANQRVDLRVLETNARYSKAAVAMGSSYGASFNLRDLAKITVWPITVSFDVYSGSQMESSPWYEAYGGDQYRYTPAAFAKNYDMSARETHSLLAGSLEYQTGRSNTSSVLIQSCVGYNDRGQPSNGWQLYNRSWLKSFELTYDSYGNVQTQKDIEGVVTTLGYDSRYHAYVTSTQQSTGTQTYTTTYAYNLTNGLVRSVTGPGNLAPTTIYSYDVLGRITEVAYPEENFAGSGIRRHDRISYDDANLKTTLTRESQSIGGAHVTYYDGLGRIVREDRKDAMGTYSIWQYTYDWNDAMLSAWTSQSPERYIYNYQYDFLGRQTRTSVDLFGGTEIEHTSWLYDDAKRAVTVVDGCDHTSTTLMDVAGRITSVREYYTYGSALFNETRYRFDDSSNMIWVRDPKGEITTFDYDEMGRVITTYYQADGTSVKSDLSPTGLPEVVLARDGTTRTKYSYDSLRRLTGVTFSTSSAHKSYSYDDEDLLYQASSVASDGTTIGTTRLYDPLGRILTETTSVGSYYYDVQFGYDLLGRLMNLTYPLTFGSRETVRYTYDTLDRMYSIGGYATDIQSDRLDRTTRISYTNGVTETRSFEANQLTEISLAGTTSPRSIAYSYLPDGNVMTEGGKTYYYDGQDRLKKVTGSVGLSYTFDANGNWLSKTEGSSPTTYSIGACNRLASETSSSGLVLYDYNREGSMTQRTTSVDTWTYSYTPDQNLERVTKNGGETDRYWYDAFGRRVKSLEGAKETITIYAGSEPIYVKGSLSATTHWFIYGPEGMLVAEKVGSQTFFCHQNGRGDVIQVTDSTAEVVWDADYKPYGEETATVATFAPSMKFVGEIKDNSTGLYGFGIRDYTTSTGRFTSEDPIRSSSSQYTYCGCDPVNNIDPQGLSKYIWRGLPTHVPTAEELAQATSVFIVGMAVLATIGTAGIASPILAAAVGAAIGAASGFASTYVVTQDVSASLQSALIGGILGAAAAGGGSIAGRAVGAYLKDLVGIEGGLPSEGEQAFGVWMARLEGHLARQAGTDVFDVSSETAGLFGQWTSRAESGLVSGAGPQGFLSNPYVRIVARTIAAYGAERLGEYLFTRASEWYTNLGRSNPWIGVELTDLALGTP